MSFIRACQNLLCLAAIVAVSGCGSRTVDVEIDGSSTVYPISEAVAEKCDEAIPGINPIVSKSGTGGGMKRFSAGDIDICDASREMKESEAELCKKAGVKFCRFMVAYDGIAMVVNPKNDFCDSLTVDQLKELYREDSPIEKWSDLNAEWPDKPIKRFGPGADSGTYDTFNEQVLGKDTKPLSGAKIVQSEEDNFLVRGVADDEYGIGYFGYAYYADNTDKLKVLGVDPGDGNPVKPTPETIRSNEYTPLSRPLYIYVNLTAFERPKAAKFIKYYIDNAAEMATKVKYVPADEATAAENQETYEKYATGKETAKDAS